jgi:hypothetical protein
MNLNLTIKSLAAVSAITLAGCLGTNGDDAAERRAFNEKQHTFAREVGVAVARSSGVSTTPGWDAKEAAKAMEQIGCPKLASLFNDFNAPTMNGDLPASFRSVISCFEIPAGASDLNARDAIQKKFENFRGLLDCLCGGTGLTDLLAANGFNFEGFNAMTSTAAGAAFNGSSSSLGSSYNGSSSNVAGAPYNGNSSNGNGSTYSGK